MSAGTIIQHKPGPRPDEPPFFRTCVRCGISWPCPTRLEQVHAQGAEILADRRRHNPQRMLDVSEVTPGCYVNWRGAENADYEGEPRGGVVLTIDHIADPETGESLRVFHTAKEGRRGIRWDRLTQDQVGSIDPPNPRTITSLRRAMARQMGAYKAAVLTDERRMAEAIALLMRSVA
ncbi:MAG: hypothetical protein LC798_20165 [Chloroflexi bacterium]|nr:hypothetical protein [Chloroflexota bacterium]